MGSPYDNTALINAIHYPAPRQPYVGHDQLFTSAWYDDLCNWFWHSHGCSLPPGHHGDHLCLTPEDEAANDYHQHGRVGIFSVCSAASSQATA